MFPGRSKTSQNNFTPDPQQPPTPSGTQLSWSPSFATVLACGGLLSYFTVSYFLCFHVFPNHRAASLAYYQQVPRQAFEWPMVAFAGALLLNLITVVFERDSTKMQLSMLACYINIMACSTHALHLVQWAPVVTDCWGNHVEVVRVVMWLHTTPHMVYLLSLISDFSRAQVYKTMAADVAMLVFGLAHYTCENKPTSVFFAGCSFTCFVYLLRNLYRMFTAPIQESHKRSNRLSLEAVRLYTVVFWTAFPLVRVLEMAQLLPLCTAAIAHGCADVMGKVVFSTSLLHSNFLTMADRRMATMKIIEEANRVQVISELQQLIQQKESFMSSMSHELRTPLNGIIGLSEALLVGSCGELNEGARKTVATIKSSGSRLLNLINDILDAAAMKRGTLLVKHERVRLHTLTGDVLDLCQQLAKRTVKLRNDVPEGLPPVLGDEGRIIQILYNLVGNACKFTHKGSISVSAVAKGGMVEMSVSDTGIGIAENKFESIFNQFEQVDMSTTRKYGGTGLGLALVKSLVEAHGGDISIASHVGHGTTFTFSFQIWTPESCPYRTSSSDTRRTSDSIVDAPSAPPPSLAIHALQSFRTRATAASAPNLATITEASTPTSAPAPVRTSLGDPTAPSAAAPAHASGGLSPFKSPRNTYDFRRSTDDTPIASAHFLSRRTSLGRKPSFRRLHGKTQVLSVDDDPINQMVISNLLGPAGYEIVQAMDGQEALQHLQQSDTMPDIILLDVMMPGMSGYEVCRKVREMFPESCTPIIMLSAKSNEDNVVEGLQSGSNDYVIKPFRRQELLARIHSHMSFKQQIMQTAFELCGNDDDELSPTSPGQPPTPPSIIAPATRPLLPAAVTAALPRAASPSAFTQLYRSLGVVAVSLRNLPALAALVGPRRLVLALSNLHTLMEDLAEQHGMHCVEAMDEALVFVAGVGGASSSPAAQALQFAQALLEVVQGVQVGACRLDVGIGIHSGPAEASVYGAQRPTLTFTGDAVDTAVKLQYSCPSACILASTAMASGRAADTVAVGEGLFLLKVGEWEQQLRAHPEGLPISPQSQGAAMQAEARALTALQQALLTMLKAVPLVLWEGVSELHHHQRKGAGAGAGTGVGEGKRASQVLERQLEEVSAEAERLQELVDKQEAALQAKTAAHEQALAESTQKLGAAEARLGAQDVQLRAALQDARDAQAARQLAEVAAQRQLAQVRHQQQQQPLPAAAAGPRAPQPAAAGQHAPVHSARAEAAVPGRSQASASAAGFRVGASGAGPAASVAPSSSTMAGVAGIHAEMPLPEVLQAVGLGAYVAAFEAEEISSDLLPFLEDTQLYALGLVTLGARLRLRVAAQALSLCD